MPAIAAETDDRPVPAAFLMRFEVDLPRAGDGPLEPPFDLPAGAELPHLAGLDGAGRFATVRVGWTPAGLAVTCDVTGRSNPPRANGKDVARGEGLHLWLDTRPTGTSHRAGRYCKRFALLPSVGRRKQAGVYEVPIMQGGPVTLAEPLPVPVRGRVSGDGYVIEAFLPADQLPGFDPSRSSAIALHTTVTDAEHGEQPLTVGGAFPTNHDPSLWTRAVLKP